ncbi:MAG: HlyD family efflux transporter periplasmic adaptor subunit [Pirellulales bacterium]|nr:HlyD family efflux transporter periplasmic adaptor subunit [Pirellulales bacterium]
MAQEVQLVADLLESRLAFRGDLRCSLHELDGKSCYVVEDPVSSQFFRFGMREWTFVALLDGKNRVREAMELAAEVLGPDRLAPADVLRLSQWLLESRLVQDEDAHRPARRASPAPEKRRPPRWPNPFFTRIPLVNPDRALAAALPWLGWIFSFQSFLGWCILCTLGGYRAIENWDRFARSFADLFSPDQWLYLAAVWVVLKMLHETAHGLACKKYGGTVPSAGITLILLSPVAFTDLTSCWRIRFKWQRIVTSIAGVYVELGVAGAAAIVWSQTGPGPVNHVCHKVVLMTSVMALVFNLNPLMRFDGYYALSDLLGIANLYPRGQACMRYLGRRWLLGLKTAAPNEAGLRGTFVKLYGAAALLWRIVACLTLGAAAAVLFHGFGLVLTALAAVFWVGLPAARLAVYLVKGNGREKPPIWQAAWRIPVAAVCAGLCLAIPIPTGIRAPAVVEYAPLAVVRIDSPGFVERISVKTGQQVQQGQVLAVLRNDELRLEWEALDLDIEQSSVRGRILYNDGELTKYQVELRDLEALKTKKAELDTRVARLTVRSPRRGYVVGRDLETLVGRFLPAGAELLSVAQEDRKQLLASVAQEDLDRFISALGRDVKARIHGRSNPLCRVKLASIAPKAAWALPNEALGAHAGGPLALKPCEADADQPAAQPAGYELLAPRFEAHLTIPPEQSASLRAGERGTVRLAWNYDTVGNRLYQWLTARLLRRLSAGTNA